MMGRSLTKRNLPDLSEGGQQQHHQEEQSSQSLEIQELKSAVSQLSSFKKTLRDETSTYDFSARPKNDAT
ncbi:hypothetical protein RIR_jg28889.t1 [Rhizophagus irregularis DAOM 181602=DAOM 197198]|nr:hypothetical protein RIR_jg28889.t1 [Rhizophagus irregularis DAOM 181602=DAOM 197198]